MATTTNRFKSHDNTPGNAVGFDFTRGPYLHSLRFAYDRYSNNIVDAVGGTSIFNPAPGVSLNFDGGIRIRQRLQPAGAAAVPIQANKQVRYDGSRPWQAHTFRFGFAVNRIDNLISAESLRSGPQALVRTRTRLPSCLPRAVRLPAAPATR